MGNIFAGEAARENFSLSYIREYFFPSGCGGCGAVLIDSLSAHYGLCGNCRDFFSLFFSGETRCQNCGRLLISEKNTCLACRGHEADKNGVSGQGARRTFVKLKTLFPYTGKFKLILGAYKFGKSRGIGNFLARYLSRMPEDFGPEALAEAAWVPVPPRPKKIKRQGWDQVEYLAGLLERKYRRFSVCRCLKRLPSRSQKELNREERGSNLKGRILCVKKPPKTAILFDDVITTGATLNACAEALLEGGCAGVYGVSLFYD